MSWLDKILPSRIRATKDEKGSVPEGLWHKCSNCGSVLGVQQSLIRTNMSAPNVIIMKEFQPEKENKYIS